MTKPQLEGRVAVVTGGNRGLGKAIAQALAREGAKILLVARDKEALEAAAAGLRDSGGTVAAFAADVSDEDQVSSLHENVVAQFGRIDILINNAGINIRKPADEFSLAEWEDVLKTNLTSAFLMTRAFLPGMRGRDYGRIINVTSTMSHVSLPGRTAYSASKAGLLGFTKALALELAPEGITVVAISPGPFATEMNSRWMEDPRANQEIVSRVPLGRWGDAVDVGSLAVFLCSPSAGYITGTDILIDGGWTAQ